MAAAVVDANVLAVVEGSHPAATTDCILACTELLRTIQAGDSLLSIDDEAGILGEYRRNASTRGQLGPGGLFVVWLLQNRWNTAACEQVRITPFSGSADGCDFAEFPTDATLSTFDRDDRKYVAVARGSAFSPPIFNATDSGWWEHRAALAANALDVRFVCPGLMPEG